MCVRVEKLITNLPFPQTFDFADWKTGSWCEILVLSCLTYSWCLIGGTHSPVQRVGNAWCIPFPRVLPNGASGIRTPDIRILRSWSQDLTARPQSPHAFYYLSPSKIHVSLSPAILFFVVTEVIIDYLHFRFRLIK